jgi:hypothetical protein
LESLLDQLDLRARRDHTIDSGRDQSIFSMSHHREQRGGENRSGILVHV